MGQACRFGGRTTVGVHKNYSDNSKTKGNLSWAQSLHAGVSNKQSPLWLHSSNLNACADRRKGWELHRAVDDRDPLPPNRLAPSFQKIPWRTGPLFGLPDLPSLPVGQLWACLPFPTRRHRLSPARIRLSPVIGPGSFLRMHRRKPHTHHRGVHTRGSTGLIPLPLCIC